MTEGKRLLDEFGERTGVVVDQSDVLIQIIDLTLSHYKKAENLDELSSMIRHYARILRGEVQDLTGAGFWRIICDRLEHTMKCKVITKAQYQAFIGSSEE